MVLTMNDVMATLTKTEYILIDRKDTLVLVCDRIALEDGISESVKRVYRIVDYKQGLVEEIDIDGARKALVKKIRDKVDLNEVLEQALKTVPQDVLLEALRRVSEDRPVKPRKGCYSLVFKGRQGQRPIELVLAQ
jgi:hypothetical protein